MKRRRGNKHFDVHFWRIRTVFFLSKQGKSASYEGRDGWKSCLFPAWGGILMFNAIPLESTFPFLYLDLVCKQLYFPPGKGINRKNEGTNSGLFRTSSELENKYHYFVVLTICKTEELSAANQKRARKTHIFRQPVRIEHGKTLQLCQPIRIEYYVTRVVSQSESSNTSPESSRLGLKTFLRSRFDSALYSLS